MIYLGWVGTTFLLLGLWFIGKKYRQAFLLTFLGEVIWSIESCIMGRIDLLILCVLFAILALRNWYLWGKA